MKKAMLPVSALVLCVLFAACGGGDKGGEAEAQAPHPKAGTTNKYGWTVPEKTIEFSVYMGAGQNGDSQEAEDAWIKPMADFLKDEFNVVIHKIVNRQDMTEHLNMLLASNNYPEVIVNMVDAMAEVFISQGKAIELTPYLEKSGPNILSGYGNYLNLLKTDDGKLYKLARSWGNTTDNRGQDFSIRYDMWKKSGLPMFDSFESFYETVKTLVRENPVNASGEKTYGMTAFSLRGEEFYRAPLALMGFKGASTGFYRENSDGTITHWVDTPEGLEVAKYINRFWRDGLIDPDFQSKTYDTSVVFMSNDRVVANMGTWWHPYSGGHIVWRATDPNWTTERRFQNVTFEPTEREPALITDNFIRTNRVILTDKCKDPEGVMTYFNWEVSPAGVALGSMGLPGPDKGWDMDENGDVEISDLYWYGSYSADDPNFDWYDFKVKNCAMAYWMMAPGYSTQGKDPADGYAAPAVEVNMWDFLPDFTQLDLTKLDANKLIDMYCMETSTSHPWDQTLWTVTFPPDAEETIIQQDITENLVAEWIRVFTAPSEAECVSRFAEMREALYSWGLPKLVAYQQAAFQKNLAKFNGEFSN